MDGVHDLGGLQNFGPVATADDGRPFHADWEGRMWGINEALTSDPGWTIDWWRFVRELIEPTDYLTRPYLDQWFQVYAALLIDSGIATVAEVASGKAQAPGPALGPPMRAGDVRKALTAKTDYSRKIAAAPAFAVGDRVTASAVGNAGHTRLPRYVRGRSGVIHAHHGAHLLPDAGARGREQAEHLYGVVFRAADLWPEAQGSRDRIFLDLWESYLVR